MRDFIHEYGAIAIGLLIGSIAHFGRLLQEGRVPRPIQAVGFFMQLGIVGLLSVVITKNLGITDSDYRALTTAILALSTQEVIQFIKRRSWRPLMEAIYKFWMSSADD